MAIHYMIELLSLVAAVAAAKTAALQVMAAVPRVVVETILVVVKTHHALL